MSREPEFRWTVPNSWVWTKLSALGDIVAGGTPSTKEPTYWGDEISWISPADLTGYSAKTIKRGAKSITRIGLANSSAKLMPSGSVHFSTRAPIGYVVISSKPLATNQGFKSLIPAPDILNDYVYYYLMASIDYARKRASGTTFLELSGRAFGDLPIPLAPTVIQHKIVARIEELFPELDKGIESLKAARAKLNVYRQAVLKHAFEGKLTAQWREVNKDKLETPEDLLARTKRAREARYQKQLQEWKAAVKKWEEGGKLGKRPARTPKLKEISHPSLSETETLPPLPDGWSYLRLGLGIDEPKYGSSKKCDYSYTGSGVLRIPNVVRGIVNASDLKGARFDEDEKRVYGLRSGDILVIRSNGSISIVGRCALISKAEEQFLYAGYLIRLRCNRVALHPEYLAALLSSHLLRTQIEHKAKSTSGVNNINSGEIQSLVVPLCSLSEQEVVVERLSSGLSSIDAIEAEIDSQLQRVAALRRSVLRKAFAGQLVAQDPNDEPASVLLGRIKAEREETSANFGTKGRKRRKTTP